MINSDDKVLITLKNRDIWNDEALLDIKSSIEKKSLSQIGSKELLKLLKPEITNTIDDVSDQKEIEYNCLSISDGSKFAKKEERITKLKPTIVVRENPFHSLQKWDGVVIEVMEDSFLARIIDSNSGYEEELEVLLSSLSSQDEISLVKQGAFFTWNIGYRYIRSEKFLNRFTKESISIIKFRRLPQWPKNNSKESDKIASEIFDFFNGGNSSIDEIRRA